MSQRSPALVAIFAACLVSLGAAAQDAPATPAPSQASAAPDIGAQPGLPAPGVQNPSQNAALFGAAPVVRLFGLPAQLQVSAPVDPSYAPTAYRTLGGQAETSADAVAEQNVTWR